MFYNNILFISEDKLKNSTIINLNVDNSLLTVPIKTAQMKYIMPVLGSELFQQIQLQISGNSVTALNSTLLDNYITPALLYFAAAEATPFIQYQFRNGGLNKLTGENFIPAELKEIDYIVQNLLNTAEFHAQRLIDYLRQNESSYPLYAVNSSNLDAIHPNRNNTYDSGLFIPNKRKC